jgi:hypothetical protein
MIRHSVSRVIHSAMLLTVAFVSSSAGEEVLQLPSRDSVLANLRSDHPRLLATQDDFRDLKDICSRDPNAQRWYGHLMEEATALIEKPPVKYEIPDGKRLLSVSREAKSRVLTLALIYRLSGEQQFADRLWKELDTVTQFKDWNPSHFLDTAEMTFAVAIGYDWLHDRWSDSQRQQLREAMLTMGLQPALPLYRQKQWWTRSIHNWNQVCNGGIAVGAMAIADEEPELCSEILHAALQSLPLAMHQFQPDGGWGEGPGYWRYATEYNVYMLAALRTALGSDFGLASLPGFSVTGDFPLHFVAPSGRTFNYADAGDSWSGAPQLLWLASAFDQPAYAAAQLAYAENEPSALDLLWGAKWLTQPKQQPTLPLDRHFHNVAVVTMRSDWNDPNAWFVGFKGGDNTVNHGQLDLGSFVLEVDGVRWLIDLGSDDYNMPGYFGNKRWTYYRNKTEGHNTLVINGQNQETSAKSAIVRFASGDENCFAVADLSAAYPDAAQVGRGLALLDRSRLQLQDEIRAGRPLEPTWHFHTQADVHIDGSVAHLEQDGRSLYVTIVQPQAARFAVNEVSLEPPQKPLRNTRRLTISLPNPVDEASLVVVFSRDKDQPATSRIIPLDKWPNPQ